MNICMFRCKISIVCMKVCIHLCVYIVFSHFPLFPFYIFCSIFCSRTWASWTYWAPFSTSLIPRTFTVALKCQIYRQNAVWDWTSGRFSPHRQKKIRESVRQSQLFDMLQERQEIDFAPVFLSCHTFANRQKKVSSSGHCNSTRLKVMTYNFASKWELWKKIKTQNGVRRNALVLFSVGLDDNGRGQYTASVSVSNSGAIIPFVNVAILASRVYELLSIFCQKNNVNCMYFLIFVSYYCIKVTALSKWQNIVRNN